MWGNLYLDPGCDCHLQGFYMMKGSEYLQPFLAVLSHEDMFWGINNGLQNYQKIKAKKIFIQQCDYRGLFFLMKSSVL